MLIDWFTVAAQALNFLILVWLLKRFLYKPILHAIDAREKRIALALADADAKKAEAGQARDEFQHKNDEFDRQRAALLQQATDEANARRASLLDSARQEADDLRTKRREALGSEQQGLSKALSRRAREEVFAIARKTLADLAGTSLEGRMTEVFLRRLRALSDAERTAFKAAFGAASTPLVVRTTFTLPPENCGAIETAVRETLGTQKSVQFETAPDQVSGIELSTDGHKVAWSIADYLGSLEKAVDEVLKENDKPAGNGKTSSDMTRKIADRAYELYEKGDHKSDSASRDWSQAEREIRKGENKAEPKSEGPGPQKGSNERGT
ncbi:MAG: DUF2934 domain-containing protein [Betaproteobacteria bacterium]|jgi:F-type H+-transporting ATPase subunit b